MTIFSKSVQRVVDRRFDLPGLDAFWRGVRRVAVLRTLWFSALLLLSACSQTYNWNQRIKLVITTPNGEVTADTVQAVEMTYIPKWMRINGFARDYSFRGEAVVADLGEGRYLFYLLRGAMMAEDVLPLDGNTDWPDAFRKIERLEGTGFYDVSNKRYRSGLVTFDDVSDPTTLKYVRINNLAETFGPGYALKSLEMEITSDPVTKGPIDTVLPWLEARGREPVGVKGTRPDDVMSERPDYDGPLIYQPEYTIYSISVGAFSTELYK